MGITSGADEGKRVEGDHVDDEDIATPSGYHVDVRNSRENPKLP